jgi:hypothetical protein
MKALTRIVKNVSAYKKKKKKKTFPFYYSTYKNKSQALLKKEL